MTTHRRILHRHAFALSLHLFACAGLGMTLLAPHAAYAAASPEYWLEYRLAGVPAGYMLERADGRATHYESKIVLNRMGSKVEIGSTTDFVENDRGLLESLRTQASTSREKSTLTLTVKGDAMTLVSEAGGKQYDDTKPLAERLYGPQGVRGLARAKLVKAGDEVKYSTFVPEAGAVSQVTRKVLRREAMDVAGKRIDAVVVTEVHSVLPVPSTLWLDADGRVVKQSQQSPFGLVEVSPGTAALRAVVDAGAELPEDTYQNAVARSNVRLPRPRSIERVVLRIDLKRPEAGLPDLAGPNQRVLEQSATHAVIEVTRPPEPAQTQSPRADAAWVKPNAILQADHAEVQRVAASLRRAGASDWQQARVLQDWVSENMQFDAGIAMVPASEVVRDRRGTCVAYAVLLTSLARSLGVPSRMVMGYVYAANMWGGHAWSEIKVGDAWVPIDAAMYGPGTADAARFALVRISETQGTSIDQAALAQLYGNEKIRVLRYTIDGRTVEVGADDKPYAVDGDVYRSATLGLTVRKAAGATFTQLDAMYPETVVVAVRDAQGRETAVLQGAVSVSDLRADGLASYLRERGYDGATQALSVAGRPALLAVKVDKEKKTTTTAVVFRDDEDMWLVRTEGDDGAARVRAVATGIELAAAKPRVVAQTSGLQQTNRK